MFKLSRNFAALLAGLVILGACVSPNGDTLQEQRQAVQQMKRETLAKLYRIEPLAKGQIERAAGYAMPGISVDGNDFSAVCEVVEQAAARARAGDGPSLIEAITYRWRGHSKSDRNHYRSKEEIAAWVAKDPIRRMTAMLTEHRVLGAAEAEAIERGVGETAGDQRGGSLFLRRRRQQ